MSNDNFFYRVLCRGAAALLIVIAPAAVALAQKTLQFRTRILEIPPQYAHAEGFGGIDLQKEYSRDTRRLRLLEDFLQDLLYGSRTGGVRRRSRIPWAGRVSGVPSTGSESVTHGSNSGAPSRIAGPSGRLLKPYLTL